MKRSYISNGTVYSFLIVLFLFGGCVDHPDQAIQPVAPNMDTMAGSFAKPDGDYETSGKFIVMFNRQAIPATFSKQIQDLNGEITGSLHNLGLAIIDGIDREGAEELRKRRDISYVVEDVILPLSIPWVSEPMIVEESNELFNNEDPTLAAIFPMQWHLRAIKADVAWSAGYLGSPDVTVAILDSGIDYLHPDLVGLVDLERSKSFIPSDDVLVEMYFPGAHPIADLHIHGTHVAATVSSNAVLAAGVTSQTTLMGVKVCGLTGCPLSAIFEGIIYAVDQRADIINMSLGGLFLKNYNPGFISIINRILNYANRNNTLIVVAAGNNNTDLDRNYVPWYGHAPSLYAWFADGTHTVGVSATGPLTAESLTGPWTEVDTRAEYSNYGRSAIDVAAPGGRGPFGSGGTVWAACSGFTLLPGLVHCQTRNYVFGAVGTSMASPHAAGVAALLAQKNGNNMSRVRQALHQTADDLGQPGTDPYYGKGRVNAARAVGQ